MKRLVSNAAAILSLSTAGAAQQHYTELMPIAGTPAVYGFGLATVDLDGDGDTDLVTGPWNGPLRIFKNDGEGALAELAGAGPVPGLFTNDLAAADVDGDGDPDVVLVNFARPMQLYLN